MDKKKEKRKAYGLGPSDGKYWDGIREKSKGRKGKKTGYKAKQDHERKRTQPTGGRLKCVEDASRIKRIEQKQNKTALTPIRPPYNRPEIHRPRLGHDVAKQPQDLRVPHLRRGLLRDEPGAVVEPELVSARTARPGAHVVRDGEEGDGAALKND
jgi:hypothetical protein